MNIDDEKKPEVAEVGVQSPVVATNEVPMAEKQAAGVLLEAEVGKEEEKVREALEKRFLLLAEDDPRLGSILDEFKSAGGEQMAWAETLDGVKKETDNFISRVENGELDQTILTMIADMEYPETDAGGGGSNGIEGVRYVRDAVDRYNLAHPDKPLQVEIILNTTSSDTPGGHIDAVCRDKKGAIKTLLELVKKQSK